jgi:DNA repair protein RadD
MLVTKDTTAAVEPVKRAETKLRDYQHELIDETVEALRHHRSVLLQAPTGAGKTEMAVEIAHKHRDGIVWFVCHRHEIVAQTSGALKRAGVDAHGVVAPRHPEDATIRMQVCSIGALRHRYKRYPAPDLIVLDECHHAAASSWAKLIKRFPDAKLLGLTATPERLDGRGLGDWFEHMIVGPGTSALIDQGYLSKFKYFAPSIPDMRGVRVKGEEYDPRDLEKATDTIVGDVIDHFKEKLAPNARALAFCVSVDAARELAARFRKAGIPAKCVDWKTPPAKRDQAVRDLASGKIRVLTNKEVFTEGFDLPAIDAVLLLRPTKSFALYRQMIGRCLRIAQGKSYTTILDHAGLIADHPFPDNDGEWSLGGRRSGIAQSSSYPRGLEIRRCPECFAVNKWSAKCPECGYVYQIKDRNVEEIYGELRELTQGAEYESQRRFAHRCKLHGSTIAKYVKQKELVTYGRRRLISIKEGLACVERLRENDAKYETQVAFAKRIRITPAGIKLLARRGLPKVENGKICIEDGLAWLKREGRLSAGGKYIRQQNPRSMPGFDNQKSFAKRIGVYGGDKINKLIEKGLPINEFHLIPVEDGLAWLKHEGLLGKDGKYIMQMPRSMPGFDTRPGFGKRIGVNPGPVNNLIKKGLPINELGLIPIEPAMQWLRRQGLLTEGGEYIRRNAEITDELIKQAMVMRQQGCTWETIKEHLGAHGISIKKAAKRRGIKVPIEGKLATRDAERAALAKKEGRP